MNSLGSSSKWPSYDSLPSTSSFILSESEQTEDETDIFSEGEGDGGMKGSLSADEEISISRVYLDFPHHADQLHSKSKHDQSEFCPDKAKHPDPASSPGAATLRLSSATPGDLAFAQKCADLHRFIHPLLELLRGLKTGRFEKGLTSFQQSVAIDRLQRILGMLQKPEMGEKYLQNLMQIEILLKTWFPREAFKSTDTPNLRSTPKLAPHRRENQLHMPVKKRKLSWTDPDGAGSVPTKLNCHQHGKQQSCRATNSHKIISTCLPLSHNIQNTPEEETAELAGANCSSGDKFTDGVGSLGRSSCLCSRRENEEQKPLEISVLASRGSPVTQDCSVSSSNVITTNDSP
ncbi:circadian associated repressor of transcription a [Melanotaenia boesemani]|uniref:circadian associated repressor of transcription a n=1 Tax=Melanotaenia boesemani TaxID=1250792 RepID=UPI001C04C057|nr:circadian associated repressor of transcription a [Melanotaenia boesemani]